MEVGIRARRVSLLAASASLAAAFFCVLATSPLTAPTVGACGLGTSLNFRTGVCTPNPPSGGVQITTDSFGGLPEIDGVECTGHNTGECIGLAEESQAAGSAPSPTSTFSGEATPTPSKAPTG